MPYLLCSSFSTLINDSFPTQVSINEFYYIGTFHFDHEDMKKLYDFFTHYFGYKQDMRDGLTEEISIAIAIDHLLRQEKHKITRNKIKSIYLQDKQDNKYQKELEKLSIETINYRDEVEKAVELEFQKILQNAAPIDEFSEFTSEDLKTKAWNNNSEKANLFLQSKKKYDFECQKPVLYYFSKENKSIINETEIAIKEYEKNENIKTHIKIQTEKI